MGHYCMFYEFSLHVSSLRNDLSSQIKELTADKTEIILGGLFWVY
jgi:hypothetical protein